MNRIEAFRYFEEYLKRNNIAYKKSIDLGVPQITMKFDVENVPGGFVGSYTWWFNDVAEVRTYYNASGMEICKVSNHRDELLSILNYINARVFLSCGVSNGLYKPAILYTPRMYMTDDGFYDIVITTVVNYDFRTAARIMSFLRGNDDEIISLNTAHSQVLEAQWRQLPNYVEEGTNAIVMGHSDISVTMNVYTHVNFDDAEEELRRMEEFRKAQAEIEKKNPSKPTSQVLFKVI